MNQNLYAGYGTRNIIYLLLECTPKLPHGLLLIGMFVERADVLQITGGMRRKRVGRAVSE